MFPRGPASACSYRLIFCPSNTYLTPCIVVLLINSSHFAELESEAFSSDVRSFILCPNKIVCDSRHLTTRSHESPATNCKESLHNFKTVQAFNVSFFSKSYKQIIELPFRSFHTHAQPLLKSQREKWWSISGFASAALKGATIHI